ncbi:PEP-CTERM sorting domain-containing protein [Citrifermentans bemidjiense]|uniref:PEP-CTERM sorting domain-containing protein n=1 Tax=Citrifermentans bemidjiense TaxID=225194 RepID=UPI00384F58A3
MVGQVASVRVGHPGGRQVGHFSDLDYNPYDGIEPQPPEPEVPPESAPVPEPSTWALMTVGLLFSFTWAHSRRSQR